MKIKKVSLILLLLMFSSLLTENTTYANEFNSYEYNFEEISAISDLDSILNEGESVYDIDNLGNGYSLAYVQTDGSTFQYDDNDEIIAKKAIIKFDENLNVISRKDYVRTASLIAKPFEDTIIVASVNKNKQRYVDGDYYWQISIDTLDENLNLISTTSYNNSYYKRDTLAWDYDNESNLYEQTKINSFEILDKDEFLLDTMMYTYSIFENNMPVLYTDCIFYLNKGKYSVVNNIYVSDNLQYSSGLALGEYNGQEGFFYSNTYGVTGDSTINYDKTAEASRFFVSLNDLRNNTDLYIPPSEYLYSQQKTNYIIRPYKSIVENEKLYELFKYTVRTEFLDEEAEPYRPHVFQLAKNVIGNTNELEWTYDFPTGFYVKDIKYIQPLNNDIYSNGYILAVGTDNSSNSPGIILLNDNGEVVLEKNFDEYLEYSFETILVANYSEIKLLATSPNNNDNNSFIATFEISDVINNKENIGLNFTIETPNVISLMVSTNSIELNGFNGTEDFSSDIDMSVFSTLNYDLFGKIDDSFRSTDFNGFINKDIGISFLNKETLNKYEVENVNKFIKISDNNNYGHGRHTISIIAKANSLVIGEFKTSFTFQVIQK